MKQIAKNLLIVIVFIFILGVIPFAIKIRYDIYIRKQALKEFFQENIKDTVHVPCDTLYYKYGAPSAIDSVESINFTY